MRALLVRPHMGHSLRPNVKMPKLLPQDGHFLHLRAMGVQQSGHTFFFALLTHKDPSLLKGRKRERGVIKRATLPNNMRITEGTRILLALKAAKRG